jgi:hypothetical protein
MRKRVTLALLAYNQHQYLDAAITACLKQACEPIEILISDDASTDGSWELIKARAATYAGPHEVSIRQNQRNLGIGGHYNAIVAHAQGDLIVTAAADDISLPHRVHTLVQAWDAAGGHADLLASYLYDMSEAGQVLGTMAVDDLSHWKKPEDWTRKRPYVVGASHAFTKRMHQAFGPFDASLAYEDQVMALRASCMGGGLTVAEPLLQYRRGGVSSGLRHAGGEAYLTQLRKKHLKQKVVFEQVQCDLAHAGLGHLWQGKVAAYLARSTLALQMLEAPDFASRSRLAWLAGGVGKLWALRMAASISNPRLAAKLKR